MAVTSINTTEPTSTDSRPRTFSRPELNSLRFLAFLLVFIDHSLPIDARFDSLRTAGGFGVPIFFILSAYLIISLLIRERSASGTINLPFFYLRRILRIWPLYVATLLASYIVGRLHPDLFMPRRMVAAFLLLMGNIYVAKKGWTLTPASILWSISVEEQFYLFIPLAGRLGMRFLRTTCWVVFFVNIPVLLWYGLRSTDAGIGLNSFFWFQFFAAGGLIAFHPEIGVRGQKLGLRSSMIIAGLLFFVLASSSPDRPTPFTLIRTDAEVLAGSLSIFYGFLYYPARKKSLLGSLGLISYGLYVFHPWCLDLFAELRDRWYHETPLANLAVNILALLLSIGIASLSYRFFEKPILRLKQRFEIIRTIRVASDAMPPATPPPGTPDRSQVPSLQ